MKKLEYVFQTRFVLYYPPEKLIWDGRTFDSSLSAINQVNEFFGNRNAWVQLKEKGWILKRCTLKIII